VFALRCHSLEKGNSGYTDLDSCIRKDDTGGVSTVLEGLFSRALQHGF